MASINNFWSFLTREAIKKNFLQNLVTQWYDSPNHNHYNIRFNVCFPFWTVFYESVSSTSVFSDVFAEFPFFRITSKYLFPCFARLSFGETTTNSDSSTFH